MLSPGLRHLGHSRRNASGWARLPEDVTWGAIIGGGFLAGIGFTMSIFIASLALEGPRLAAAKIGILAGSLIAAASGMTILLRVLPRAAD